MSTGERSYGDVLRERIESRRMSLAEVERASGVTSRQIERIISGKTKNPSVATRRKLDEALSRPPVALVGNAVASNAAAAVALSEQIAQMQASLEARLEDVLDELAGLRHELAARQEWLRVAEQVFDVAP